MVRTDSLRGRLGLAVTQCAGMVDLVALPVWVGVLMQHRHLDPQQAGLLVTLFLGGAVVASLMVAPNFHRLSSGRAVAVLGFLGAALAFHALSIVTAFSAMATFHGLGGLCIGAVLSVKDGTIARSTSPHRLFALCGAALGLFALVFLGAVPPLLARAGGPDLFHLFSGIMVVGAVTALLCFPAMEVAAIPPLAIAQRAGRLPSRALWAGIVGLCCMSVVQAMAFGFLERHGMDRGFGVDKVTAVLVALGVVNLFPTVLAAVLEARLAPRNAMIGGAVVQAALVLIIFTASAFAPYALAGSLFVAVMLFTHVFGFGLLAKLDPSGRVLAASPAMMMGGAALGPVLGGTLVKAFGFPALGWAALVLAALASCCFAQLPRAVAPPRGLPQGV